MQSTDFFLRQSYFVKIQPPLFPVGKHTHPAQDFSLLLSVRGRLL